MSSLFKCCAKDPKGSFEKLNPTDEVAADEKMDSYHTPAPEFSDEAPEKAENGLHKPKPNLRIKVPQPIRLKNYMTPDENLDVLHSQMNQEVTGYPTSCTENVCQGALMDVPGRGDIPRPPEEVYEEAQKFLQQYYASIRRENSEAHLARLKEVRNQLAETGTYQLTTSELFYGTKLGWRNATRCIGRIQWKKLRVFDCRAVTTATGMFQALCKHIQFATNKGNIRSAITIFAQRTDGKHDYRIWNPQLISYAGYLEPDGSILGDRGKLEFTDVCLKLGWKPPRTAWDILPLVLQADGKDPEFFEIPREIVMEVHLEHPNYEWFKELGLRWYALPAVSSMRFDCGGLEFTASAFNGWYMGTEVGCRNLCDSHRLNVVQTVATKMGLDTNSYVSLWKDKALVEVNVAVLYSYHRDSVAIVDHHSASEQFIVHMGTEARSRGGCPSDWVWIVPPMSGSLCPVFHQEMVLYYLRPSYDYQVAAWKTYQWPMTEGKKSVRRKFHFKQIARAVKFTSKLFGNALSKRIKATIIYGSETGKSEQYAKELGVLFGHAFNAQVHCMSEYDAFSIEHENLVLIVTSTFGNGEPPANGVDFFTHLCHLSKEDHERPGNLTSDWNAGTVKLSTPKSLMRANSIISPGIEYKKPLTRLESSQTATSSVEHGMLSNVCFAVFALGSSAYPKFCNFGKTVDKVLGDLGGERLLEVGTGDELCGQEQQFKTWASKIFHIACETFALDDSDMVQNAKKTLNTIPLTEQTVRFSKSCGPKLSIKSALEAGFRKQLTACIVKNNNHLGICQSERATIFVDMEPQAELKYEPGDHVGIMACNRKEIVDAVLAKLSDVDDYDRPIQVKVMKETLSPTGVTRTWERHERLPVITARELFTRFLDITSPPQTKVLKYLAQKCTEVSEAEQIKELIQDEHKFDDWCHFHHPNLAEVLSMYPSCKPQGSLLAVLLPPLQPRFYSISSSPLAHPGRIHATVAVVRYQTQDGTGPTHYGVCSTYLHAQKPGDELLVFIRRAPGFHMPKDITAPLILVGPGTGIAPFRGFWSHRRHQIQTMQNIQEYGPMWLFFGCRNTGLDLYKEEKEQAISEGVLTKTMLALSRESGVPKQYVQALLEQEGAELCRMLLEQGGHFYVCGDCKMAEDVWQKLQGIFVKHASMTDEEAANFLMSLMDENRYHEDIFGITLRTAEVHSASRESAKRTRLESAHSQSQA